MSIIGELWEEKYEELKKRLSQAEFELRDERARADRFEERLEQLAEKARRIDKAADAWAECAQYWHGWSEYYEYGIDKLDKAMCHYMAHDENCEEDARSRGEKE